VPEQDTPTAPARVTVHPSIAWPFIITTVVFIGAWLYAYAGRSVFEPWWLLGAVPVLAALGTMAARSHWPEYDFGVKHTRAGVTLARVSGLVYGLWLAWSGWAGPAQALPLLGLAVLPLWAWFALLSWQAPKRAEATAERNDEGRKIVEERTWRAVLDKGGCEDVVLTEVREHRAGVVLTVEPDPDVKRAPTYEEFSGRARSLSTQAALHYKRLGRPLPRNAVWPEPGDDDATYLLHVTMRDVFTEATRYVPDYAPGDIARAFDLGEYEDASRILIALTASMKIVGRSGAGKSVVANNLIARITACSNALLWVCATDKLIPLVWPWVRPFFAGECDRPVLDWVAGNSVHAVLRMLRAAYKVACDRNDRLDDASKMTATPRFPLLAVAFEEVSHAVEFKDKIRTHDGQDCTVSDLIKMIAQNGRSANVRLVMLSQYGINAALGDRASETIRNIPIRICLQTMESHDGTRTLSGLPATVDTSTIPLYTMLVQPDAGIPRVMPAKAAALEGSDLIREIAIRQAAWRPDGIEPETELGADYEDRWDEIELPELARSVKRAGLAWRGGVALIDEGGDDPEDEDEGPEDGPTDEDGEVVDTTPHGWTDQDDAAFARLLGSNGEPEPPANGLGTVPDSTVGINRLNRLVDEMNRTADEAERAGRTGTPPGTDEGGTDGPAASVEDRSESPVPEPLRSVVAWVEATFELDPEQAYTTDRLAEEIGYEGGTAALGKALGPLMRRFGYESRNVARRFDPAQRKGYRSADLREAADRYRYGMP
jgi:hypothetical protein